MKLNLFARKMSERTGNSREILYEFTIIVGKAKKLLNLVQGGRGGPRCDCINLSLMHMHAIGINSMAKELNLLKE